MIQEQYITFETAKLLKKKGFKEITQAYINADEEVYMLPFEQGVYELSDKQYPYPTQQMAMRWLREKRRMDICLGVKVFEPQSGKITGYSAHIWYKPSNNEGICCYWVDPPNKQECWESYEDACEASIQYCLKELME